MKIVITANGTDLSAPMDRRFGRAPWLIVADTESGSFEAVENTQNLQAAQGAGIQSAQAVLKTGAEALVTGNVGPKAFRILAAAKLPVYLCDAATVQEALEEFKTGKLSQTGEANVEGHWM